MVDAGIDLALSTRYIEETFASEPDLSGVLDLFRKARMTRYLHGPDLRTVFAPLNDALADAGTLSEDDLASLLRHHILGRAVTEAELRTASSIQTLAGDALTVSRDGATTRIGNARIIRPDVECTNGVIHVIDRLA